MSVGGRGRALRGYPVLRARQYREAHDAASTQVAAHRRLSMSVYPPTQAALRRGRDGKMTDSTLYPDLC